MKADDRLRAIPNWSSRRIPGLRRPKPFRIEEPLARMAAELAGAMRG